MDIRHESCYLERKDSNSSTPESRSTRAACANTGPSSFADRELEFRIHSEYKLMADAPTEELRLLHFERMRDLIAQRSPAQVARMEAKRSLR